MAGRGNSTTTYRRWVGADGGRQELAALEYNYPLGWVPA